MATSRKMIGIGEDNIAGPTVEEVYRKAAEVDRRRRIQVDAQKQVINRLLQNRGWSWEQEQAEMLAELVESRAKLEAIGDYVTGMKYSNVAREVLKVLDEDIDLPDDDQ